MLLTEVLRNLSLLTSKHVIDIKVHRHGTRWVHHVTHEWLELLLWLLLRGGSGLLGLLFLRLTTLSRRNVEASRLQLACCQFNRSLGISKQLLFLVSRFLLGRFGLVNFVRPWLGHALREVCTHRRKSLVVRPQRHRHVTTGFIALARLCIGPRISAGRVATAARGWLGTNSTASTCALDALLRRLVA